MNDTHPLHTRHLRAKFRAHLRTNAAVAAGILSFSLLAGMMGYRELAGMTWIDAFLNASMLLSGMGPMSPLTTDAAKLFAGIYALYCGVVFVATVGLVLSPVLAHGLRRFHVEEKG